MKVVSNNILVIDDSANEKKSKGGIIISSTENLRVPVSSKVIAVGPDVKSVAVGDTVFYPPREGESVKIDDVTYRAFSENSVIMIV